MKRIIAGFCSCSLKESNPCFFGFGTGDTLGFPKRNTDHKPEKARLHVVQGVPRAWGYEDLQSFLEKQQWTEISALSKRRSTWSFLAKAPEEPTARASWQYDIQDADTTSWSITIQVAVRSQNGPQSRVAVTGPRKIRTLGDFIPEDYSAANDSEVLKDAAENSTVQNVPLQPPSQGVSLQRDGRASPARGRSRSPKGTNEVAATVPDSQSQGEETSSPVKVDQGPPKKPKISEPSDPTQAIDSFGWRHWDQGGTGDCFFRVASVFMSNAAERPSAEDSRRDGAWLRAQTCQHLKKHEVRFGQLFQNKSEWATWLASVARPNTWAEGKAIQALSEKIGKPLIIWEKKTEDATVVFTRFVVAPKFSKGFACGAKDQEPVCAILENKHYTVLRPPHKGSVPASWLRETPNTVIDLQGGAKQCDTRSARLSFSVQPLCAEVCCFWSPRDPVRPDSRRFPSVCRWPCFRDSVGCCWCFHCHPFRSFAGLCCGRFLCCFALPPFASSRFVLCCAHPLRAHVRRCVARWWLCGCCWPCVGCWFVAGWSLPPPSFPGCVHSPPALNLMLPNAAL